MRVRQFAHLRPALAGRFVLDNSATYLSFFRPPFQRSDSFGFGKKLPVSTGSRADVVTLTDDLPTNTSP
jgi:hypothetical protein